MAKDKLEAIRQFFNIFLKLFVKSVHRAIINCRQKINYLHRMKSFYKVTYINASQGGMVLKLRYRDIICFEIANIHGGD